MNGTGPTAELRVEELATRAGVGVDTVRYYQGQGLLAPPRRRGRTVVYDHDHLRRLREIRALADRGFTLAQIAELDESSTDPLLASLAAHRAVDPDLDVGRVADRTGLDAALVEQIADVGLLETEVVAGRRCFAPAAVEVLDVVARVLAAGVPAADLADLAVRHARHVEELADQAIELYRRHRHTTEPSAATREVETLIPLVGAMVGAHFQATLVERAAARLEPEHQS